MWLNPKKRIVSRKYSWYSTLQVQHIKSRITDGRKEKKQREKTEKSVKEG